MGCSTSNPSEPKAFSVAYALGPPISEGSFGLVSACRARAGNQPLLAVAVGLGCESDHSRGRELRKFQEVVSLWRTLGRHDHLVELVATFEEPACYYMVMKRCECSLMDRQADLLHRSAHDLAHIFKQMLFGLGHLHRLRIAHRNLRPKKFLLGGRHGQTVKLGDFSQAIEVPSGALLEGRFNKLPFMSPEMVGGRGHSLSTDMWSLGITLYVLIYGHAPYSPMGGGDQARREAVLFGAPWPRFAREAPDVLPAPRLAENFVRAMLRHAPGIRCTAEQALRLPLLNPQARPAAPLLLARRPSPSSDLPDKLDPAIADRELRARWELAAALCLD